MLNTLETNIENYIEFVRSGLSCGPSLGNDCQGAVNKDEDYKIKGVELSADYRADNFNMGLSYARAQQRRGYGL
ncbi:hypothetical protein PKHYL_08660 [Psychrobacter sp. KH172YL61]|nr:hypothetical protein PKHYL_08660 [Psychrobacter sp. KH172YL61]